MATRTPEAMLDLVMRHGAAEIAHDWHGALATMSDDPYYEWYPLGVRVRGPDAVTLMWQKLLSDHGESAMASVRTQTNREWIFADHVLATTEWAAQVDGRTRHTRNYTIFGFVDDRISCEITYCDEVLEQAIRSVFDDEFMALPGVERIPVRHTPLLPEVEDLTL